jgi:hypothetical protein
LERPLKTGWLIYEYSTMDPEMVDIIVGPNHTKKTFTVHKELLCYYSNFFRNAFNGDWRESDEQELRLEGVTEDVFRVMIHWLYAQSSRVAGPDSPTLDEALTGRGASKRARAEMTDLPELMPAKWLDPSGKTWQTSHYFVLLS